MCEDKWPTVEEAERLVARQGRKLVHVQQIDELFLDSTWEQNRQFWLTGTEAGNACWLAINTLLGVVSALFEMIRNQQGGCAPDYISVTRELLAKYSARWGAPVGSDMRPVSALRMMPIGVATNDVALASCFVVSTKDSQRLILTRPKAPLGREAIKELNRSVKDKALWLWAVIDGETKSIFRKAKSEGGQRDTSAARYDDSDGSASVAVVCAPQKAQKPAPSGELESRIAILAADELVHNPVFLSNLVDRVLLELSNRINQNNVGN